MFEKEAEDSFKCKKVLYKLETDKHSYIDGFKDGATFGYDKANELEKEKCELLGLIQAKDKLIEKMKRCKNCEFSIPICDTHCQDCDEHYSNWRLAE